jgi:hypothetical protein
VKRTPKFFAGALLAGALALGQGDIGAAGEPAPPGKALFPAKGEN